MLDNREIAVLFWLLVAFGWALSKAAVRQSLRDIALIAKSPVIILPFSILILWIVMLVTLGRRANIWTPDLLKDSVIWFFVSAIALFMNAATAWNDERFFRRTITSALGLTAFLGFFFNLYVFHWAIELVLQPLLAAFVIMTAVAATKPEYRPAKTFLEVIRALMGFVIFAFVTYRLIGAFATTDWNRTAREFALPIWLTIGLLPFIYLLSLYAAYDSAFVRVKIASDDKKGRVQALIALILTFHFRMRELAALRGHWARRAADAPSLRASRDVIQEFRLTTQAAHQKEDEKQYRLRRNAGVTGMDSDGRQLDQREFDATRKALRTLSTAHMGWYRRCDRYRKDLLPVLESLFDRDGLPSDHGIELRVSEDGQAWWAWRRTINGWCFAIGAVGPPPDQWLYDGPDPPKGFPGDDDSWGERWGIDAANW